jgi:hypothetical protein
VSGFEIDILLAVPFLIVCFFVGNMAYDEWTAHKLDRKR